MMQKINIATKEIITCLIQDKLRLQKANDEKDEIISKLRNQISRYEESVENAG